MNYEVSYPIGWDKTGVVLTDELGRKWREARPSELEGLDPEALVVMNTRSDPVPAGKYEDLVLPGGYPFLAGMAQLRPIYIPEGGRLKKPGCPGSPDGRGAAVKRRSDAGSIPARGTRGGT